MTTKVLKVRTGTIKRDTTETQIALKLVIDGQGVYKVSTGIRFFDHMLELFTRHGGFDLTLDLAHRAGVYDHCGLPAFCTNDPVRMPFGIQ